MREHTFRRKKASQLFKDIGGEVGWQGGWPEYFWRASESWTG